MSHQHEIYFPISKAVFTCLFLKESSQPSEGLIWLTHAQHLLLILYYHSVQVLCLNLRYKVQKKANITYVQWTSTKVCVPARTYTHTHP